MKNPGLIELEKFWIAFYNREINNTSIQYFNMINFDTYIGREVYILEDPLNNFNKLNWMNLIYESIERKDYAFILER
ncbi:MAG TPA: hypothetical protein PLH46_03070 [Caldisericia bacterium]|nr:hypothetical protein [Caldisericia bacterium]